MSTAITLITATSAEWSALTVPVLNGFMLYETDTQTFRLSNGTSLYSALTVVTDLADYTFTQTIELPTNNTVQILTTEPVYSSKTQEVVPVAGGTVTAIGSGITEATNIVNGSGTLATLTCTLTTSPGDGATSTWIFVDAVTAITWAGGTVNATTVPTTAAAGTKIVLTYNASTATWY